MARWKSARHSTPYVEEICSCMICKVWQKCMPGFEEMQRKGLYGRNDLRALPHLSYVCIYDKAVRHYSAMTRSLWCSWNWQHYDWTVSKIHSNAFYKKQLKLRAHNSGIIASCVPCQAFQDIINIISIKSSMMNEYLWTENLVAAQVHPLCSARNIFAVRSTKAVGFPDISNEFQPALHAMANAKNGSPSSRSGMSGS